jgi:hypothetical protein
VDGNITFNGIGGNGSQTENRGIVLFVGGVVESTGIGSITFNGTGGNGTSANDGIHIRSAGTRVSSFMEILP